jgi:asparagine synthase (glutamine-hydrolysing)
LEPGGWLLYRADGTGSTGKYWRMPEPVSKEPAGFSAEDASRRLRETFDEAVRMRMIADVPLGAFLSGGIDSSCVVASMARQSKDPVKTFSIGFEESAYNELKYAALVARHYKTDHHEIVVRPDSVSLVEKLVHHFDEPFGTRPRFQLISSRNSLCSTLRSRCRAMAATSYSADTIGIRPSDGC